MVVSGQSTATYVDPFFSIMLRPKNLCRVDCTTDFPGPLSPFLDDEQESDISILPETRETETPVVSETLGDPGADADSGDATGAVAVTLLIMARFNDANSAASIAPIWSKLLSCISSSTNDSDILSNQTTGCVL